MGKENFLRDDSIVPELTENVKSALSKFKSLSMDQKSTLLGGFAGSFQDNGIGEDLFPNYDVPEEPASDDPD